MVVVWGIGIGLVMVWGAPPFWPPRSPSPLDRGPGQALALSRRGRLLENRRVCEHREIYVVAKVFVGGCLPCPSRLSTPVTLTLALSRRAGEGIFPSPSLSPGWDRCKPDQLVEPI